MASQCIRNQRDVGDAEVLAIALVVAKEEDAVDTQRAAEGGAVVVSLKVGEAGLVEVVARIEEGVAKKLVRGAVKLISARRRNNRDLGPLALAVAAE